MKRLRTIAGRPVVEEADQPEGDALKALGRLLGAALIALAIAAALAIVLLNLERVA